MKFPFTGRNLFPRMRGKERKRKKRERAEVNFRDNIAARDVGEREGGEGRGWGWARKREGLIYAAECRGLSATNRLAWALSSFRAFPTAFLLFWNTVKTRESKRTEAKATARTPAATTRGGKRGRRGWLELGIGAATLDTVKYKMR